MNVTGRLSESERVKKFVFSYLIQKGEVKKKSTTVEMPKRYIPTPYST